MAAASHVPPMLEEQHEEQHEAGRAGAIIGWVVWAGLLGLGAWGACGAIAMFLSGGPFTSCDFGDRVHGWTQSGTAAFTFAAVCGALWLIWGAVASFRPQLWAFSMTGYVLCLVAALLLFCSSVAPAIWGSFGCDPGPGLDFM